MNVSIDFGNTRIKGGAFEAGALKNIWSWSKKEEIISALEEYSAKDVIISSVSGNHDDLAIILGQKVEKVLILDSNTPLPIVNHYQSPETLGMDRVAAVCGAKTIFSHKHCLVVDFGTCITYDFVDKDSNYLGGAIAPGMRMRFKAMNAFTKNLPLIESIEDEPVKNGQSTKESMISGVLLGIIGETEKYISLYRDQFGPLQVLFTGGDAQRFESIIKEPIFAAPNLVLIGLNSILTHNNELTE